MSKSIWGAALFATAAAIAIPVFAGSLKSGLAIGEMVTPFHPKHVSGPLKGTDSCPPCTYGDRPAVQVWVNGDDPKNVAEITKWLSSAVTKYNKAEFKAFVIVLTDGKAPVAAIATQKTENDNVHIAYLNKSDGAVSRYKFNEDAKNTVIVYKDKKVTANFVNLKADKAGLETLSEAVGVVAVN
jgi:hypothetical protein